MAAPTPEGRKALIRKYKETARPMGVFRVLNRVSGRQFLGSSVDLPSALNRNRAQLGFGGHPNKDLQRDWDAQPPEEFDFEVVDTLEPKDQPGYDPKEDLAVLLEMWRDRTEPDRRY